jgi:TatD DNase family protein
MFIDTHAHIYLQELAAEREGLIRRAREAGIERIYMPAIDSSEMDALLEMEASYPDYCYAMMGLHPCYVKENYEQELALVETWLGKRKFAAVGEIGLDYYWDRNFDSQQLVAFQQQMQWALKYQLPVVIHTRNAMEATIEAVQPFAEKGLRGIFHCFSGNGLQAKQITEMGFFLGIGGVVTYKNSGLAEALHGISPDWLVLETDMPYLAPVPHRGKKNEVAYLPFIAQRLSEVCQSSLEQIATITSANALKIFGK